MKLRDSRSRRFVQSVGTRSLARLVVCLGVTLAGAGSAMAASSTWTATGNGAFNTSTNWFAGTQPGVTGTGNNGDTATFNTTPTLGSATVTLSPTWALASFNFDTNVGSYTFTGGTYHLESGGSVNLPATVTSSGQTETINSAITMGGSLGISNNATTSDTLILGNITGPAATHPLALSGTNTGANAINGVIADGVVVLAVGKSGPGSWIFGGANTFSAGTGVSAGTLLIDGVGSGTTSSGAGTGTVSVSGTGSVLGGSGRILGVVTIGNTDVLQGGDGAATGTLTLVSNPVLNTTSIISLTLGVGNAHSSLALPTAFAAFQANQSFTLAGLQTGVYNDIITGVAASVDPSGWTVTNASGATYSFTNDTLGDIDLTIATVPEPSAYAATLLMLGAVGWQWRRRRQARRS